MSNPEFYQFPLQNDRTGYKPVYLPFILVMTHVRTSQGIQINDTNPTELKFYIESVIGQAKVAGVEHQGLLVPNNDLYAVDIPLSDLFKMAIDPSNQLFLDADTKQYKDFSDVQNGDLMEITLRTGNIRSTIAYYNTNNYYDLSTVSITTSDLKPIGQYKFVWQVKYYNRLFDVDYEFISIDNTSIVSNKSSIIFNHPGDVHQSMISNTPQMYFDGVVLDQDNLVSFYRPLADALQDIFDEQKLLLGINWIDKIPAQYMPYLAYLLGWDLPYFDSSTDEMRRVVLKNARRLQELKGTKRVIVELFEMLGFTIDVANLWYRSDGEKFLAPNETPPEAFIGDKIITAKVVTTDLIISAFSTDGFKHFTVPFMRRPIDASDIIISAYLVADGSDVDNDLIAVAANLSGNTNYYDVALDDISVPSDLDVSIGLSDSGKSVITIDTQNILTSYVSSGNAPVNNIGVKYNIRENIIDIELDRFINENDGYKLYVFATYSYTRINVPNQLIDLRSNRFDITILKYKDGDSPPSDIIDFLLSFLFKVKAFHSLLRKLSYTITFTDVYNVSDFTVGGTRKQHSGTDAGELQVSPAIIPTSEPISRGFKKSDFKMRSDVLTGLETEHDAWKSLEANCGVTQLGQDRVITDLTLDLDHDIDTRNKLCDLDRNTSDYTYKGRIVADLLLEQVIPSSDDVRSSICTMLGNGEYYMSPVFGNDILENRNVESINTSKHDKSFTRVMAFDPEIHYIDRGVHNVGDLRENRFFAIRRPSLGIEKPTLFFPGCRFVAMGNLTYDVEISQYTFRPWDDIISEECPENKPVIIDLNTTLSVGSDGDEVLDFDQIPLTYYGNGLPQDLMLLDEYGTGNTSDNITIHAIYSTADINPYVDESDDGLVRSGVNSICVDVDVGRVFDSMNPYCECFETGGTVGGGLDYIDGYPAESGIFNIDASELSLGTDVITAEILTGLGVPDIPSTGTLQFQYRLGSGVKLARSDPRFFIDKPIRLDCSCSTYDCGSAELDHESINRCNIDLFVEDGQYDFDIDKLSIINRFRFDEEVGACSILLDGTIPTLFELSDQLDSFRFMDEYGIIYQIEYESIGDRIDMTWTTYDPRVPGVADTGRIEGINLYRNGVITTVHQITEYVSDVDDAILIAEGSESVVGEFKVSVFTNTETPVDPFKYHLNCEYVDELNFTCNGGICIGYAIREDDIVTILTSSVHGFSTGDTITINGVSNISGVDPNGVNTITEIDDHSFSYNNIGPDGGPVFGGWVS